MFRIAIYQKFYCLRLPIRNGMYRKRCTSLIFHCANITNDIIAA